MEVRARRTTVREPDVLRALAPEWLARTGRAG